jgi:hypothetical protein
MLIGARRSLAAARSAGSARGDSGAATLLAVLGRNSLARA